MVQYPLLVQARTAPGAGCALLSPARASPQGACTLPNKASHALGDNRSRGGLAEHHHDLVEGAWTVVQPSALV